MAHLRDSNEYTSTTCIQTIPQSSLQILCKCRENGQNGVSEVQCNGNCVNQENQTNGTIDASNNSDSSCESEIELNTR